MNKIIIFIVFISASLITTSCFKEDEIISPHQPGDLSLQTIGMGQYYTTQAYFDLGTNSIVGSNSKDIFDLRFDCGDSTLEIRLNSGRFMRAAFTGDTNFFTGIDTNNRDWYYDAASGTTDSLAIFDWYKITNNDTSFSKKVFIIDRGINAMGIAQGVRKMRILSFRNKRYEVEYANLDNSNYYKIFIDKKTEPNYVQLNLNAGENPLNIEPAKDSWDLFFTQYTDILTTSDGEKYPYLVTGVLINSNKVMVALDSTAVFENITRAETTGYQFSTRQNIIGYEWKHYDFANGYYSVLTNFTYIIQDVEGYYYKLRFIGFYNNLGEKGYPQFEFQRL